MSSSTTPECKCRISLDFDILRQTDFFSGVPVEVVKLFAYLCRRRSYHKGENIFVQGEKAENCYLIISGEVEIINWHRNQEIVIQRLHANAFFGELALLARFDWFFSAKATAQTEVLVISREGFQKVLNKYPEKRDTITEKVVQLRVSRFANQTTYLLDRLMEAGLNAGSEDQPLIA